MQSAVSERIPLIQTRYQLQGDKRRNLLHNYYPLDTDKLFGKISFTYGLNIGYNLVVTPSIFT